MIVRERERLAGIHSEYGSNKLRIRCRFRLHIPKSNIFFLQKARGTASNR